MTVLPRPRSGWWELVLIAFLSANPKSVLAQAWLPPKGETSVTTGVQMLSARWHFEFDGRQAEEMNESVRNVTTEATYGLADRVAIDFGIPFVASRFRAIDPCPTSLPLACATPDNPTVDNGKYYATPQDFWFDVR